MERTEILWGRTHRVGSITAGLSMVVFGILSLLHTLFGVMSYQLIFSFWPVILIGMGVELLLSNCVKAGIVYDKAAVFLLIVMICLAMGLAWADVSMEYFYGYFFTKIS